MGFRLTQVGIELIEAAVAGQRTLDGSCWGQKDIAAAAGIDERTYRRLLSGHAGRTTIAAVCQALGIRLEDVVETMEPDKSGQLAIVSAARVGPNPFEYGKPVTGDRFCGRERELKFIRDRLSKGTSVSLIGLRRIGKTSLLQHLVKQKASLLENAEKLVLVYLDLSTPIGKTPETVIEGLRRGIKKELGRVPWKPEENADPWAFQEGLEDIRDRGYQVVVMLDEFEAIERQLDLFQEWGNDWRSKASTGELFTLMTSSTHFTF